MSDLSRNPSFKEGRQFGKPVASMDLQERTLRVSNYGRKVTESILRELFSQGGPVRKIVFRDQFSFIEFEDAESVSYCLALFDGIELFGERLQLAPKINHPKVYDYLNTLKQYEHMFVHNPLQWWNRFGDSSKPCPTHICSYSPNAYNYPRNNFELYNAPMNSSAMMNNPAMMNSTSMINNRMTNPIVCNQMISNQMIHSQMINSQMMNSPMMPTSSNYAANDLRQRTNEPRWERDFNDRKGRSYNQLNRKEFNDFNNNDNFRSSHKVERARFGHLKRTGSNFNSNGPNKKMRKHQSF